MPFTPEEAQLVLVSAPWGVTASYGGGQSYAPDAIIKASTQLDFYDPVSPDEWRKGIATAPIDYSIQDGDSLLRGDAQKVIKFLEEGGNFFDSSMLSTRRARVNMGSAETNCKIYEQTSEFLHKGKLVGLVGGDHSTPLGYIKALGERNPEMGILHIDAHADLREAYEGFRYSHASIMYNVLQEVEAVKRIVQVGVRDYCDDEVALVKASEGRVVQFDDYLLSRERFEGTTWAEQCRKIVELLPEKVYVSFDIDGLAAENCPGTGTPVTGGLSFNEALYLLEMVVRSGRRIIGFDLVEVAPSDRDGEWNANVGARMLFKMCGLTLKSN
jgi:agmatinase